MLQGYVKSVNLSHVNDQVHKTIQENLVSCVNRGKDLVSKYARDETLDRSIRQIPAVDV